MATTTQHKMNWIDIASLKLMAATIWLAIFTLIIPETIIAVFAVAASATTIAFNIHRFYESRKQKDDDRTSKPDNKTGH